MAEDKPHNSQTKRERPKLGMTCTSTDCKNDQHYFGTEKKRGRKKKAVHQQSNLTLVFEENTQYTTNETLSEHKSGCCCKCGVSRVEWERLYKRNISDIEYTIVSLNYGCWQNHWLHKDIDLKAINHARRKGFARMQIASEQRIRNSVRKAVLPNELTFDGRQTPNQDNALYYAQHAMACCCRKCIELWHGIPQDRDLTEDEISYFTSIIMAFVRKRLPNLTERGEKVPAIRRKQTKAEVEQ